MLHRPSHGPCQIALRRSGVGVGQARIPWSWREIVHRIVAGSGLRGLPACGYAHVSDFALSPAVNDRTFLLHQLLAR